MGARKAGGLNIKKEKLLKLPDPLKGVGVGEVEAFLYGYHEILLCLSLYLLS